ncbi:MAG: hypothetical protein UU76_C0016G0008 [Parcubacteria group bacterium GW2011_GWC1_41_7]|nr:MAG: hypothetical protein UU76_C0016G0008 [Parcubacteria group bacterium GW2011_GWC1_41_7]
MQLPIFKKIKISSFLVIFISIIICIGAVRILFVQFGVFRKKIPASPEVQGLQQQVEYFQNYPIVKEAEALQQVVPPVQEVVIPDVSPSEVGKSNLFE